MNEKLPTIKLKGKEYVQVKDRVIYFNENYKNGSIETDVTVTEAGNHAWFMATIVPDVTNPTRKFTARSGGPIDEEKSYEKLETVAVGRALALMGIGIIESIASADEIDIFQNKQSKPNYAGTQYEQRKGSNQAKIEFLAGDKLVTGISNKTGSPVAWFAIQRGKEKIWLKKEQYEYLANNSQGVTMQAVREVFSDGSPLPTEH